MAGKRCRCGALVIAPMQRQRGFTLIETLIVVAIVGILAAIAGPSLTEMIRNSRLAAASSALQVSMNLARSEAVKRGADARVTVAANGSAGVWTNGWTVFVDTTTNANSHVGLAADGANGTRLEKVAPPASPVSVAQNGLNYFIYNGQGRLISEAGAAVVGQSIWFYSGSSDRYCLIVANTGRVRVTRLPSATVCA